MPSWARAAPIADTELYQVKGFPYTLTDLLGRSELVTPTATAAS